MADNDQDPKYEPQNRPRVIDTTNMEARAIVSEVLARLQPVRSRIAVITARSERKLRDSERQMMIEETAGFQNLIERARLDLIESLLDAPDAVAGHSRISDVEKAIDSLEISVSEIRTALART